MLRLFFIYFLCRTQVIIVDEVRYRHATSLLSRTDYSLEQIADELGYSDVANFSRAFKRWSGRSPSNWRKDPYL